MAGLNYVQYMLIDSTHDFCYERSQIHGSKGANMLLLACSDAGYKKWYHHSIFTPKSIITSEKIKELIMNDCKPLYPSQVFIDDSTDPLSAKTKTESILNYFGYHFSLQTPGYNKSIYLFCDAGGGIFGTLVKKTISLTDNTPTNCNLFHAITQATVCDSSGLKYNDMFFNQFQWCGGNTLNTTPSISSIFGSKITPTSTQVQLKTKNQTPGIIHVIPPDGEGGGPSAAYTIPVDYSAKSTSGVKVLSEKMMSQPGKLSFIKSCFDIKRAADSDQIYHAYLYSQANPNQDYIFYTQDGFCAAIAVKFYRLNTILGNSADRTFTCWKGDPSHKLDTSLGTQRAGGKYKNKKMQGGNQEIQAFIVSARLNPGTYVQTVISWIDNSIAHIQHNQQRADQMLEVLKFMLFNYSLLPSNELTNNDIIIYQYILSKLPNEEQLTIEPHENDVFSSAFEIIFTTCSSILSGCIAEHYPIYSQLSDLTSIMNLINNGFENDARNSIINYNILNSSEPIQNVAEIQARWNEKSQSIKMMYINSSTNFKNIINSNSWHPYAEKLHSLKDIVNDHISSKFNTDIDIIKYCNLHNQNNAAMFIISIFSFISTGTYAQLQATNLSAVLIALGLTGEIILNPDNFGYSSIFQFIYDPLSAIPFNSRYKNIPTKIDTAISTLQKYDQILVIAHTSITRPQKLTITDQHGAQHPYYSISFANEVQRLLGGKRKTRRNRRNNRKTRKSRK